MAKRPESDRERSQTRPKTRAPRWHELGDFIVSFGYVIDPDGTRQLQTRVHYSQGDQSMQWKGVARRALFDWIEERSQAFLPVETGTRVLPGSAADASLEFDVVSWSIADVRGEVPDALRAMARVRLAKTEVETSRTRYAAELVLTTLDTMERAQVGLHTEEVAWDEVVRDIVCDFPVPRPGQYEVQIVLRSMSDPTVLAESNTLRLNVEP